MRTTDRNNAVTPQERQRRIGDGQRPAWARRLRCAAKAAMDEIEIIRVHLNRLVENNEMLLNDKDILADIDRDLTIIGCRLPVVGPDCPKTDCPARRLCAAVRHAQGKGQ